MFLEHTYVLKEEENSPSSICYLFIKHFTGNLKTKFSIWLKQLAYNLVIPWNTTDVIVIVVSHKVENCYPKPFKSVNTFEDKIFGKFISVLPNFFHQ